MTPPLHDVGPLVGPWYSRARQRLIALERRVYAHRMKWLGFAACFLLAYLACTKQVDVAVAFVLIGGFFKWIAARGNSRTDVEDIAAELNAAKGVPSLDSPFSMSPKPDEKK